MRVSDDRHRICIWPFSGPSLCHSHYQAQALIFTVNVNSCFWAGGLSDILNRPSPIDRLDVTVYLIRLSMKALCFPSIAVVVVLAYLSAQTFNGYININFYISTGSVLLCIFNCCYDVVKNPMYNVVNWYQQPWSSIDFIAEFLDFNGPASLLLLSFQFDLLCYRFSELGPKHRFKIEFEIRSWTFSVSNGFTVQDQFSMLCCLRTVYRFLKI